MNIRKATWIDSKNPSIKIDAEDCNHMVFKVAGERARELSEWSKRSFESKKPFGQANPRF